MYSEMIAEAVVFGLSATRQVMDESSRGARANVYLYVDEQLRKLMAVFTAPLGVGSVYTIEAPSTDAEFWQYVSHFSAHFMRESTYHTTPDKLS